MSRFAYEPDEKLLHGHVPQLRTARDLLRHLKVADANATTKSAVVQAWLASHEPDDLLAASLARYDLPVKRRAVLARIPVGGTVYQRAGGDVVVVYSTEGSLSGALFSRAVQTLSPKPKQLDIVSQP
jgi:hypothetical protein